MKIPAPVLLGLALIAIYLVATIVGSRRRQETKNSSPRPGSDSQESAQGGNGNEGSPPKRCWWKRLIKWVSFTLVSVLAILGGLFMFKPNLANKVRRTQPRTEQPTVVVLPDKWRLAWQLPHGETYMGYNSFPFRCEVVECDAERLWLVLHGTNARGEDERLANLTLQWFDQNLEGSWLNLRDGDGGKVYLYRRSSRAWTGTWEHKDGSYTDIILQR